MKKTSYLSEVFSGELVTVVLDLEQSFADDDGMVSAGLMMTEAVFIDSDDEFVYLGPDLDVGITEAIPKARIARLIVSQASDPFEELQVPEDSTKIN